MCLSFPESVGSSWTSLQSDTLVLVQYCSTMLYRRHSRMANYDYLTTQVLQYQGRMSTKTTTICASRSVKVQILRVQYFVIVNVESRASVINPIWWMLMHQGKVCYSEFLNDAIYYSDLGPGTSGISRLFQTHTYETDMNKNKNAFVLIQNRYKYLVIPRAEDDSQKLPISQASQNPFYFCRNCNRNRFGSPGFEIPADISIYLGHGDYL